MRGFGAALACAVLVAAASAAPATAAPDGCRHATVKDVGAALGTPVTAHASNRGPGVDACSYRSGASEAYVVLTASRVPAGTTDEMEFARVTGMTAAMFGVKPVPMSGLGDQAVTITHVLWIRRHSSIFSINVVQTGGPAKQTATAVKIARTLRE